MRRNGNLIRSLGWRRNMALTDVQKRLRHLSGRKSWLGKSGLIAQRVPSSASDRDNCHHRTKTKSTIPPLKRPVVQTGSYSERVWLYSAPWLHVPRAFKTEDMTTWRLEDYFKCSDRLEHITHSPIHLQFSKYAVIWPDHPVTRCDDFYLPHCRHWFITEEVCLG